MERPEIPTEAEQDDEVTPTPTVATPPPTPPVTATPPSPAATPSPALVAVEDPNDLNSPARWKHRRRLAYTAMVSILTLTVYVMGPWLPVERLTALNDVITWFYFTMASIVGAYMGFATWSAKTAAR